MRTALPPEAGAVTAKVNAAGMPALGDVDGGVMTMVMLVDHRLRKRTAPLEIPYGIAIAIAALLILREPNFYHFG